MKHSDILKNTFTKLSTISGLPQIVYPNVSANPTGDYLEVYVMPAETMNETIDGMVYKFGIIQVNCVTSDAVGTIKAAEYADKIIEAFKVGTVIATGLTVYKPSYASSGMNTGDGHYRIPVTIRYQNYTLE